jgi:hypothetical protein
LLGAVLTCQVGQCGRPGNFLVTLDDDTTEDSPLGNFEFCGAHLDEFETLAGILCGKFSGRVPGPELELPDEPGRSLVQIFYLDMPGGDILGGHAFGGFYVCDQCGKSLITLTTGSVLRALSAAHPTPLIS